MPSTIQVILENHQLTLLPEQLQNTGVIKISLRIIIYLMTSTSHQDLGS